MKHLFTLIFFLALGINVSAQIETDPSSLSATITSDSKATIPLTVINTSAESFNVYWKIILGDDWNPEWTVTVCDAILCYPEGTLQNNENKPNEMVGYASNSAWSIKVDPKGASGASTIKMEFYDRPGLTSALIGYTEVGDIIVEGGSSVQNVNSSNLVLYPNPTQHYFSVKNDADIASISLMNIVGKEMWNRSHVKGASYDVSELFKGMYLVRLMDSNDKLVKTIRLNKTSI